MLLFLLFSRVAVSTVSIACVAGGISHVTALFGSKAVNAIAKAMRGLGESRRRFFFELYVHQSKPISDWLRVLKRQSNVNRYLSSFPGYKVCKWGVENAKKCIKEGLDPLKIRRESIKITLKEKQGRPFKSRFRCKMGLTSLHSSTVRDI